MIKKLVIPFSNNSLKRLDYVMLCNSIYSIRKVGYEVQLVTEQGFWNLISNSLIPELLNSDPLIIHNKYDNYYGSYKFNYYKYLLDNWDESVMIIDHDIYLNSKFSEPNEYDIWCHGYNFNTNYDREYIKKYIDPDLSDNTEVKSIGAGFMKFINTDVLKEYYDIVNDNIKNGISDELIKYYEQFLPIRYLSDLDWKFYYDTRNPIECPNWDGVKTKYTECHVDFTNKDNQYCHFAGSWKRNKTLINKLENNLKIIRNERRIM